MGGVRTMLASNAHNAARSGALDLPVLGICTASKHICAALGSAVKQHLSFVCSAWTHKLITAKDHASVQLNVGHLNEEGVFNGQFSTFALTGKVRIMGESDRAIDNLWKKKQADSTIPL